LLKIRVEGEGRVREIEATLHRGPRVVRLDGVELDFDPGAHILLMRNEDKPGVIGQVGSQLGAAGINIINFSLGAKGDGQAVAAITVDEAVSTQQLRELRTIPGIVSLEMM
jgi:predicted regulator of amino acid metabolism with ACT domain